MKKILFALLSSVLVLSSCNDDRLNEEAEFEPMDEFFDENKPEEQEFVITSDTGDAPIKGRSGTELYGFRDILTYPNGDAVPLPYSLKLIELYTYKDMILYQFPSTSSGALLETGGDVKITAFHDGNELIVKAGERYPLVMATQPTVSGMQVYDGNHPNNEFGNWVPNTNDILVDTGRYGLGLKTLGWKSPAKATSGNYTDITLTVEGKGGEFIELFLVTEDFRSILKGESLMIENAAIGEAVTLVAMAKDQNDDYRLHKSKFVVNANMEIELDMKVVSKTALLGELAGLN